jgi:hypothetical protein
MKTYIAKTDAEALGLHNGMIMLLVMPFMRQPPEDCSLIRHGLYHPIS